MKNLSTKPYLLRALYEWCSDSGLTPYLSVKVDGATRVPQAYVKNGEIVLNIGAAAVRNLTLSNEVVQFSARFNGVSHEISVPIDAIQGLFARETGQGMFFDLKSETAPAPAAAPAGEDEQPKEPPPGSGPPRPKLTIVK